MGVQSSTMLLMAKHGLITPMPDAAIVGDTVSEPVEVYEHLRFMRSPNIALPFPVNVVSRGSLGKDIESSAESWTALGGKDAPRELWRTAARIATPPFFTRGPRTVAKTFARHPKAARNPNWQAKVRQKLRQHGRRVGPGRYLGGLAAEAGMAEAGARRDCIA